MDSWQRLDELRSVKRGIEDELLERPGVFGVDIGRKVVGGRTTDELAIRVYVKEKKDVSPAERIPPTIQGMKTDVIQGEASLDVADTAKYNPLVGGISIGTCAGRGVGTLGAIVIDNQTGNRMLLSNWHVLNPQGAQVAQPGLGDGGICGGSGPDIV